MKCVFVFMYLVDLDVWKIGGVGVVDEESIDLSVFVCVVGVVRFLVGEVSLGVILIWNGKVVEFLFVSIVYMVFIYFFYYLRYILIGNFV